MSRLPLISLAVSLLACLTACSTGEPIDLLDRDLLLADDEDKSITAEFVVEVTDHGRPVVADSVFGWNGGVDATDAYCMVHAGLGRCATWFVTIETPGPMTIMADVCGELYSQPFQFAFEPVADSFTFQSHVTIEADATRCGRARPLACEGDSFASPALEIEVVDASGDPIGARNVSYELEGYGTKAADCVEGGRALGCSEWASQHADAGRYRASVDVCGATYQTDWVKVGFDDSGCKPVPERVALVVDSRGCDVSG